MDKIIIKGLRLFAYHGVNPEEKEQGQDFVLDIAVSVNMNMACSCLLYTSPSPRD